MGNQSSTTPASAGEKNLRGTSLEGSEQSNAADHLTYAAKRNPDTTVRVDGEEDSLYNDGLEVGDDSEKLADTHDANHLAGVK